MERSRADDSHPAKRPLDASHEESLGQSPNTGDESGGAKPTTDDALKYLKTVKLIFQDEREKYDQFLSIMKEFKAQRTSTEEVIVRVKDLFKGHSSLIYGFNAFLPKGYEISLDEDGSQSQPKKVEFKEAIDFVGKVKKHFEDNEDVYLAFINILSTYRKEDKNFGEVYAEVTELFEDHPDLLDEFSRFIPDNSATTSAPHAQHGRNTFPRYDDRRVSSDDQNWRRERVRTSLADIDEQSIPVKSPKDPRKREKDSRDRRNRILENRAPEHDAVRDLNSQRYSEKKKSAQREGLPLVPYDDRNALKSIYSQEFTFCERVKEMLGSDDYQAFLKCLHIYSTEIITRTELQNLITDLLGKYPDLMEGFNVFLEGCENIDGFLAGVTSKRSLWNDQHLTRSTKSDDKDKGSKRDSEAEATKEKKEKYCKSIQDLDLSKCQRCTPSYRLLPEDYPIHTASQRSELGFQVLNDRWVSVTSGSEDYSFKHMRRNQYEESLFKCEDDRFELDMLIESVSSTAKRAEGLLNNIKHNIIRADAPIRVEDHFTAINIRCIERLYGDHALDALDALRKHPAQSLPAVLNRLKQKQDEWTKCRSRYNKIWAEIFAKNHYKSLDHRSFYFKQQDSKTLSMKSFVAEIKRKKENIQEDDSLLFSVAAAYKRPLVPHLELFFPDADIHRDIRKIVKFSCEELCSTKEQINKVMKIWYTLCEPMLGVVCQPQASDNVEERRSNALNGLANCMEIDARSVSAANAAVSNATTSGARLSHPDGSTRRGTLPDGSRIKRRRVESSRSLRSEKEEGELSPHGYFEEDDSSSCWDTSRLATENASEASGESGDDEFSREGHEEGEDAENEELSRRTESGSDADVYHNGQLQSAQFLINAKPLKRYISSEIECPDEKCSRVFYGNDDFYLLFRLHSMLYERLLTAKKSSSSSEAEQKDSRESRSAHPYSSFMSVLFSLLDGSLDDAKYENECQTIFGKQAYVLFTLDKLLYRLVKQLQAIATDEVDNKLLQLFEYEASRKPVKSNDLVYHENLLVLPLDEKDKLYRIEYSSAPARLTIHLMDKDCDKSEAFAVSVDPKFSAYLQNDFLSTTTRSKKEPSKIFLRRNKRRYAGVDDKSAAALAIEDAQLLNGLEYKMLCSTSKIFYVLGTEDFFYQPPGKRCNLTAEQRAKRDLARARRLRKKLPSA